jgi:hypothetical protein
MQVRSSSGWTNAGSSVNGTSRRFRYVATAGQTTFTGADANSNTLAYDAGFIDVFVNGSRLDETEFTASSGTSIVLGTAAVLSDEVNIVAYGTFQVANLNGADIQDGTVTVNKLGAGAVSTAKVADAAVTQAKLAANVAGNGPAFSAYRASSIQTISPATWTKIQFNAEEFDTASAYDQNTNYRFQPNIAGYYQFNFELDVGGTSASAGVAELRKNGSPAKRGGGVFVSSINEQYICGSVLIYLNGSTDYVEIYAYVGAGANVSVYPSGAGEYTYFQGFLAKAA